jgi:hypothetical protein
VPGLGGVLARQFTLEVIPVWLVALFVVLLALYRGLSVGRR